MSIKRILVPVPDTINPQPEIDLALSAATFLEAHVEAHFIWNPPPAPTQTISYASSPRMGPLSADIAEPAPYETRERQAGEMRERFVRACGIAQVPIIDPGLTIDTMPSARWCETEGRYTAVTAARAAAFDLVVAGSGAVGRSLMEIAETALLEAGRPVLLTPLSERQERSLSDAPMIAWEESPQCWRAVTAAVPFLQRATSVQIVSIGNNGAVTQRSLDEVVDYLACHGVAASARRVDPHSLTTGEALLAEAAEQNAGLLVMGAYSHSRLREMLLGGATRHVLANTAATPVLMMH